MCNIIHTDLKPENAILSLRPEELAEISNNGCLKDPKHKPTHVLDGQTNFADLALGSSYQKKYGKNKQADNGSKPLNTHPNVKVDGNADGPPELQYADIIPDYAEMSKNKKKKIRSKHKIELREANEKLQREWEAARNSKDKTTGSNGTKATEDAKPDGGQALTAKLLDDDEEPKKKRQ